jgi:cell wall-associated NlpC family hydrolase
MRGRDTSRRTGRSMRTTVAGAAALVVVATLVTGGSGAHADPTDDPPSQADVDAAKKSARDKARDVAAVQADLVLANQRLDTAAIEAGKAAEAYNGARWKLQQARKKVRAAEASEQRAAASLKLHQVAYGRSLAASYALAPELTALSAMMDADGVDGVMERSNTLHAAQGALNSGYGEVRAAATLTAVATTRAEDARADAKDLADEAADARDEARDAESDASAEAAAVAAEKSDLIAELARLQNVSVELAADRQRDLEQRAAEAAAAAAAEEAADPEPSTTPVPEPTDPPDPEPEPEPEPDPDPPPSPDPAPPPPASGSKRAIGFARAQIGEPYEWGAAGPGSWDCSGLTMGAWRAGGKYLPHYSVEQYRQSTAISEGNLRPGDLVFWADNRNPDSIYHVALYSGNGMIIHAPRTGRNVEEVSMHYWIAPTFFARP